MLKEFRNTLTKVIHLRSIIGYNSMVFALRQMPFFGKLIPDALYRTAFLKVIYWIFHVIKEVFMLFAGKIAGLGLIYLVSMFLKQEYLEYDQAEGVSGPELFASFSLLLFIIYALFGLLLNTRFFKCTTEKEYLVFMLRMNAKKLNTTMFVYDLGKLVIGYLIAGIVAIIGGAPFWLWLGIPVLAVFIKLFGAGAQALSYRSKRRHNKPMRGSTAGFIVRMLIVMACCPFVIAFVANGYYIPLWIVLLISVVFIILGIFGFVVLKGFDANLNRLALRDNIVHEEVERYNNCDNTRQFKKIKANGTVKGDKKGFEYLNALFVKRHSKMLVAKPVAFTIMILAVMSLFIFGFIYSYYRDFGTDNTWQMVVSNLANLIFFRGYVDPLHVYDTGSSVDFFRWVAQNQLLLLIVPITITDVSVTATQAFYINCDNSLMTFSFFKQREKILELFNIRLKLLIKLNIIPAVAMGLFENLFLFYSGGQDYPFQYLLTMLVPIEMSILNSVTWLALYYLFQPFTTTVNVKGGAYNVARIIISSLGAILFMIPCNSLVLAGILTVFTVFYVILLRSLVRKYAQKTWKAKA